MRLLIVEDSLELADWLARILRKGNYAVDCIHNAEDAFLAATAIAYDLLIVDLGLPAMDGMELIKKLRQAGLAMPIIILTAVDTVTSRVRGLDLGADDYLVKPFEISELEARIRVQLRRHGGLSVPQISFGDLTFDMAEHKFTLKGNVLDLTSREYAVLEALISRPGAPWQNRRLSIKFLVLTTTPRPMRWRSMFIEYARRSKPEMSAF